MALELVYTSALQGLRAGASGFCTVAMTKGMPPALVPRLEALGGYRAGPTGDGPVSYCFWRVETASGIAHVLSIVGPAPPDHTARTNKIATYLVLSPNELAPAGPAALLAITGLVRRRWTGAPAWIEQPVRVPSAGDEGIRPCVAWEAAAGDAGWAGVLASGFLRDQSKPTHVIYGSGVDPLPLVDEAIRLLPGWARWRATFSTYFLQPVAGTPCAWRFCLDGTPAAEAARQSKGLVIDLTRMHSTAPDSRFTRMARTGIDDEAASSSAAKARDAARASLQARVAANRPIELEPDSGSNEGQHERRVAPRLRDPAPVAEVPAAQPVKPMIIALVAAGLTLLMLLLVVLIILSAKGTVASAPAAGGEPAAVSPGSEQMQDQTDQAIMAAPPMKTSPATASITDPAAVPLPGFGAAESPPAIEPASTPAGATETGAATPQSAMPPAVPPPPPTPAAPAAAAAAVPPQPAAPRVPVVPAAPVTAAKWVMSFSGGDSTSSYARCDLPGAKSRTARIVVPTELRNAGAAVDGAGGATFGSTELRASARIEDGVLTVSVNGSGEVPEPLVAFIGKQPVGKPMTGVTAVQRALERCTVEVLDSAGGSLGIAQMRPRVSKPLMFAAKPSAPVIVETPDVALNVQLLVSAAGETPAVAAEDRAIAGRSTELTLGSWLRVVVDRGVQKSALLLSVALPADVPARRTALSADVTSLNALKGSCNAVKDAAQSGRRGAGFDTDLQAVRGALTDEELARVAPGAGRGDALDEPATMIAAADAVQSRVAADLQSASRLLNDLNEVSGNKPKLPSRVTVRIFNDDGIVLVESEVKASLGGGS